MVRVVIVPGNGAGDVTSCMWYPWIRDRVRELGVEAVLRNMPDSVRARELIWLPFMQDELACGEDTIIVGHSSGAEAAMRYAESHRVLGIVLVAACVTDLGDAGERASGYYSRPWEWERIRANVSFVVQFGSDDDPFIPIAEMREVAQQLQSTYHEFTDRGHFQRSKFPELLEALRPHLNTSK